MTFIDSCMSCSIDMCHELLLSWPTFKLILQSFKRFLGQYIVFMIPFTAGWLINEGHSKFLYAMKLVSPKDFGF